MLFKVDDADLPRVLGGAPIGYGSVICESTEIILKIPDRFESGVRQNSLFLILTHFQYKKAFPVPSEKRLFL
jgi:hypothetical protein